jgi:dedicator of cytokinesis protein 3
LHVIQVALLHSISAVYEQLIYVLPVLKITKLATSMLESLPRELPPQLTQAKLTAIRNLVTSKLFTDDGESNQCFVSVTEMTYLSKGLLSQ